MFSGFPDSQHSSHFLAAGGGGERWRVTKRGGGRRAGWGRAVPRHLTVCSGLGGSVSATLKGSAGQLCVLGAGSHVWLFLRILT